MAAGSLFSFDACGSSDRKDGGTAAILGEALVSASWVVFGFSFDFVPLYIIAVHFCMSQQGAEATDRVVAGRDSDISGCQVLVGAER